MSKPVRGLGQRAVRLGAAASLAASLALTVCATSNAAEPNPATNGASTVRSSLPPAKGQMDLLKWGVPYGEPASLDPARGNDNSPAFVDSNICDGLLRLKADYSLEPGLATSWTFGSGNRSLTFHLRAGVKFSDGSPMTAEDVQFSLARHMNPAVGSVFAGSVYGSVDRIEVTGPSDVTVTFKTPDALFLTSMSNLGSYVVKKAAAEAAGKSFGSPSGVPVCTGAYKVDKWSPGSGIQLSANPLYWDAANKPHAQRVSLQFISDAAALTQALKAGAIDGSYEVPPSAIAPLRASNGEIHFGPSPTMLFIYPVAPGPLTDVNLRRALDKLIDRSAIAQKVYFDAAAPVNLMVPPILWNNPAKPIYEAAAQKLQFSGKSDLAAAKEYLAKVPKPIKPLTLIITAGNEPMRLVATLLIDQAKAIGLDIRVEQIQPTENAAFFSKPDFRAKYGADMIMINGWSAIAESLYYPRRVVVPGGLFNLVNYENAEVTKAVNAGIQAFDVNERAAWFTKAQAIYEPDKPILPIVNTREVLYLRKGLAGATTSFAYVYSSSLAKIGPAQ